MSPVIAGGNQTQSYKNVAVIMLEGLPYCTATLVSPSTLVTAAHCVQGRMTRDKMAAGKVTAVFGSVYSQPMFPPVDIVRAAYPDSGDVVFDPGALPNDIALVFLKEPFMVTGVTPAPLHTGTPS